jgi:hypothetical protein
VADWDRGTEWSVYDHENNVTETVSRNNFRDYVSSLPRNSVLYIEGAHLQRRTALSVAQVYDDAELLALHNAVADADITIKVFPEMLTFRAKTETGLAEPEEAIFSFLVAHPEIKNHLMTWHPSSPEDEFRWAYLNRIRDNVTVRLNILRPDYKSAECDWVASWLDRNFDKLSEDVREVFRITKKRKILFNKTQVMTVYVSCFDENGYLRLTPHGKFVGTRTLWAIWKMHPYHRKAGTARSNLMYHLLRNMEKGGKNDQPVRAKFRKAIKDLVRAFRDLP